MMELLWTPEAVRDREDIYDYIEEDNPLADLAEDAARWAGQVSGLQGYVRALRK